MLFRAISEINEANGITISVLQLYDGSYKEMRYYLTRAFSYEAIQILASLNTEVHQYLKDLIHISKKIQQGSTLELERLFRYMFIEEILTQCFDGVNFPCEKTFQIEKMDLHLLLRQ